MKLDPRLPGMSGEVFEELLAIERELFERILGPELWFDEVDRQHYLDEGGGA